MADDSKEIEQAEESPQAPAGKSKKGIIIIAVAALLAVVLSVAATLFLLGGDDQAPDENAETEITEEGEQQNAGPALYYEIKPAFLSTFSVGNRQRYMQITLSVSSREQQALDAVDYHMPLLKSKLNSLFGSQDFEQVQTDAGKNALREKVLSTINEVLEAEQESLVENVFFINFVLQ